MSIARWTSLLAVALLGTVGCAEDAEEISPDEGAESADALSKSSIGSVAFALTDKQKSNTYSYADTACVRKYGERAYANGRPSCTPYPRQPRNVQCVTECFLHTGPRF